jgi:hypothetical protein
LADDLLARDDSRLPGDRVGEERRVRVEVAQKEEHEHQEAEPVEERVVEKIVEKTDVDRSE